jgi:hypothetical protein
MIVLATVATSVAAAAVDPFNPDYHCWVSDVPCLAAESVARTVGSTITNFGNFVADMLAGTFNHAIGQSSWDVSHGQFLFWVAVMTPVIMIIAIVQIGISAILQDWRRLGRVAVGAVLAVPFAAICVYGMQQFAAVTDNVTTNLVTTLQGGSMSDALLNIFGMYVKTGQSGLGLVQAPILASGPLGLLGTSGAASQSNIGAYILALLLVGVMVVASMFLFVALALRDYGLLALAAMAPIGLMMIGQPKFAVWAERWGSLTLGLLLAKPLAAGVLLLAVQLTASTSNIGFALVTCAAIFAAAFSPLWATSLVAFAGRDVGTALHRRVSIREQVSRGSAAIAPARAATRLAGR